MLVLSRQVDEIIMIGDDILVTCVDIRGDKVRIGFTAPPEIAIHRKEVYDAIMREYRTMIAAVGETLAKAFLEEAMTKGKGGNGGMLVLSRQVDETVLLDGGIEVTIVDIRGDKVRFGITAPKELAVHRKEVYEAIKRENRLAGQVKPLDALPSKPKPKPAIPAIAKLEGQTTAVAKPVTKRPQQQVTRSYAPAGSSLGIPMPKNSGDQVVSA